MKSKINTERKTKKEKETKRERKKAWRITVKEREKIRWNN